MFNKNRFQAAIKENGKTLGQVARYLGIDSATLYRKMNGTSDFYRMEIQSICDYLNLESPQPVFFDKQLIKTQNLKGEDTCKRM